MPFMDENLFLTNDTGRELFAAAKDMPIFDYHCHLNPDEIRRDHRYASVGELFLGGDHYKWRAMRSAGVTNDVIFGGKADNYKASFFAYAKMLERAAGNPLLHWTHLELQRVFGIYDTLNSKSAPAIWEKANAMLDKPGFSARGLIERFNVAGLCTTDDPADDLSAHAEVATSGFKPKVLPAFRPDRSFNMDKPDFTDYVRKLGEVSGKSTATFDGLLEALSQRLDYFHEKGSRLSDHGLDTFGYEATDIDTARRIYKNRLDGQAVSLGDRIKYRSYLLVWLGAQYHKRGWTQQYHIGALRNNNTPVFEKYGADIGMDSVGDREIAEQLSRLLDAQASAGALPKTILYSINPKDNFTLATMIGNFQGLGPGYMQWGAPWWFGDQRDGIEQHLRDLGNLGMLGYFVGMLTDSRSFTSYTRHEYFRRVLCDLLGKWVELGEIPKDMAEATVRGVCFDNAAEYFGIDLR